MTWRFSLEKAFVFSLGVHCAAAVSFGFTFGVSPLRPLQRIFFSGELFSGGVVAQGPRGFSPGLSARLPDNAAVPPASGRPWAKPAVAVCAQPQRSPAPLVPAAGSKPPLKEPVLLLHPQLPAQFDLYFKDRQEVHIELLFSISPAEEKQVIEVKRSVSSGNLQADLLSRRYISHYLFIQRGRFAPGQWHPVKVDLSVASHDMR